MTTEEIHKRLIAPFRENELEWRIQSCGQTKDGKIWARVLAYIQARAIQNRFDEVLGMEHWQIKYRMEPKGFIGILSLRLNGEWITREDGAEATEIEPFKGGMSGAFKRVSSVFGVGRYLYELEAGFAIITEDRNAYHGRIKNKDGTPGPDFYWTPPPLPAWALPSGENEKASRNAAAVSKAPPVPGPQPMPPMTEGMFGNCEICATPLQLSKAKTRYYCPNFKDSSKGEHTTLKIEELEAYKEYMAKKKIAEDDIPF